MYGYLAHKLITASSALAAAGVLACSAAILEALMPKASVAGFLASTVSLGLVVAGVVIAFGWCCEAWENCLNGRLDRILGSEASTPKAAIVLPELTKGPRRAAARRMDSGASSIKNSLAPIEKRGGSIRRWSAGSASS
jgi:hypothetical protein